MAFPLLLVGVAATALLSSGAFIGSQIDDSIDNNVSAPSNNNNLLVALAVGTAAGWFLAKRLK